MVFPKKVIEFPIEEAEITTYRLRKALSGGRSRAVEITVPRDFIRALAWRSGLSYEDFVSQCKATAFYVSENELLYRFERVNGDRDGPKKD